VGAGLGFLAGIIIGAVGIIVSAKPYRYTQQDCRDLYQEYKAVCPTLAPSKYNALACTPDMSCAILFIRADRLSNCAFLRALYMQECPHIMGQTWDAEHVFPIERAYLVAARCYDLLRRKGCFDPEQSMLPYPGENRGRHDSSGGLIE
jgi:hypothetical protein